MRLRDYLTEVISSVETKKIGIVGYTDPKFDKGKAKTLIRKGFEKFSIGPGDEIVSGLTDTGISSLAYREARKVGAKTVGIACSRAKEHKLFPVDKTVIKGKKWGDESSYFLSYITHLIKIGGGKQSEKEFNAFRGPKVEYNLPEIKE